MKTTGLILTTALAAMAAQGGDMGLYPREPKEPKNKYNLTENEVVYLSTLTPKQKKIFLRMSKDERYELLNYKPEETKD